MIDDDKPIKIKEGKEARESLWEGIDLAGRVVGSTMGVKGKNVILRGRHLLDPPQIISDGFRIADSIYLEDEIENLGARAILDVAENQNQKAGDGTTTSVVLCHAIVGGTFQEEKDSGRINTDIDVGISDELEAHEKLAQEELKKLCKPIDVKNEKKAKEALYNVALSSYNNPEMAKIISDMSYQIGGNGKINVDEYPVFETTSKVLEGMRTRGRYTVDYQITNVGRMEAVLEDVHILVTNTKIETMSQISDMQRKSNIIDDLGKQSIMKLVIFAPSFGVSFLKKLAIAQDKGWVNVLAVTVPSLTSGELEDLSIFTGARFITDGTAKLSTRGVTKELRDIVIDDLGFAVRVSVEASGDISIAGGKGTKKETDKRILELKLAKDDEVIDSEKKRIEKRIGSMASGQGMIVVGGETEGARKHVYRKTEDAGYATQHAIRDGVVPGGGLALKTVSDKLPDGVLKEALKAPYDTIQRNAGKELKIGKNVLDPYLVTKTALSTAVGQAKKIIAIDTAISPVSDHNKWKQIKEALEESKKEDE